MFRILSVSLQLFMISAFAYWLFNRVSGWITQWVAIDPSVTGQTTGWMYQWVKADNTVLFTSTLLILIYYISKSRHTKWYPTYWKVETQVRHEQKMALAREVEYYNIIITFYFVSSWICLCTSDSILRKSVLIERNSKKDSLT